jgi:hypothetical protein
MFLVLQLTEVTLLSEKKKKNMTVEEAGKKGGQKVRKLVEEGKEHEEENW